MSVPVWVLLGFAAWTYLTLFTTVGWYRWSRILTRQAQLNEFRADVIDGDDWYRRAMRAHTNCLENLPVYGAVVVAMLAAGVQGRSLDVLAVILLAARICQTITHIAFEPTNRMVGVRFSFFLTQAICVTSMGVIVAVRAISH